jgi:hypothetical protein
MSRMLELLIEDALLTCRYNGRCHRSMNATREKHEFQLTLRQTSFISTNRKSHRAMLQSHTSSTSCSPDWDEPGRCCAPILAPFFASPLATARRLPYVYCCCFRKRPHATTVKRVRGRGVPLECKPPIRSACSKLMWFRAKKAMVRKLCSENPVAASHRTASQNCTLRPAWHYRSIRMLMQEADLCRGRYRWPIADWQSGPVVGDGGLNVLHSHSRHRSDPSFSPSSLTTVFHTKRLGGTHRCTFPSTYNDN